MRDGIDGVLHDADVIVIGNQAEEFRSVPERLRKDQQVIDLVHLFDGRTSSENYQGICW
jgi:hypothetical protein